MLTLPEFSINFIHRSAVLDSIHGHVPANDKGTPSEVLSLARSTFLIPLSASNPLALDAQAARLVSSNLENVNVVDLSYTLGTRRSRLSQKGFTIAGQKTLKEDLKPDCFKKNLVGNFSTLPIAFVFTGQGAQWPQMGKELLEEFPSFRHSIQELDAVLQKLPERPSWTLEQALLEPKETSQIYHVTRSQPVCTAVQIALVQLLAQWEIKPQGVVGHSSGEICAAFTAGRLTAAQAIIVAYYRGYVVGKSEPKTLGAMMAASLGKDSAEAEIERLGLTGIIKVACVNSPESVTISGDATGIDAIIAELAPRGILARKLNTDGHAYHSHHMLPFGKEYQDLLEGSVGLLPTPTDFSGATWVSSVYGEVVTGKVTPSYWRKNLESPVLFSDALGRLVKGSKLHLIEIGPHSALEMPIKQTCKKLKINDASFHYSTALSRGKNGVHCLLNLMGNLFLHGHEVAFAKVNFVETANRSGKQGKLMTDLPPYPWTYDQVLFNESRSSRELRTRKHGHHDLLGIQAICGNGISTTWRNTLRVKDVPWIESHKLGQDIVFPGAGYIAMAIEAISQVTGTTKVDVPTFVLRHVNIIKAFPLSGDENDTGIEVFTTLNPTKLSGTTSSSKWFDFEISSFENEKSTIHSTGMIGLEVGAKPLTAKLANKEVDLQEMATRNYYDRFAKVGLNFGPAFQSMEKIEIDRKREHMSARAAVKCLTGGGAGIPTQSSYIMHPITIDAMLQTALVASSAGVISKLTCMVPTVIEHARFRASVSSSESWIVDAISEPVGPGSIQIAAEIHDGQGQVCGQLEHVSAVAFQGANENESSIEGRHPMMRVIWKPDITKLTGTNVQGYSTYLAAAATAFPEISLSENLIGLAALSGIVAHKKPRVNILELGNPSPNFTKHLVGDVLRSDTPYRRCASYMRGYFTSSGELFAEEIDSVDSVTDNFEKLQPRGGTKYDLIIFPNLLISEEITTERFNIVKSFLSPQGIVLGLLPSTITEAPAVATCVGLSTVEIPTNDTTQSILVGKISGQAQVEQERAPSHVVLVERENSYTFNDLLFLALCKRFNEPVERVVLSKLNLNHVPLGTTVISTIELYEPLLATMSESEMVNLKVMTDNATNILWITGGGQIEALRPTLAMVSGFSRSLVLEQPSLRLFTFDIDDAELDSSSSIENIIATLEDLHSDEIPDSETVQKNGLAYISRFVPEEIMNATFRQKLGDKATLKPLGQTKPARLTIKSLGQFDTLAFKQDALGSSELRSDFVEVDVKSVGLNAKDVFVYSGKVDTRGGTSSLECAGVITRIGSKVSTLQPGDRVVVMAPGHFATLESFPEWACEKLMDSEEYNVVSTLPLVFATALYGLCHRANIREHETVLIHSGAGGVGIAAIQIAQLKGAEIFATVSTEEKKDFLVNNFGIKRDHIFSSRDSSFLAGVLAATDGKGVDVVLNSLTGDLLHDSFRACARFGRFVEIGKKDLTEAGRLDMQVFRRNVTFTAFDVSELCDVTDQGLSSVWER